MYSALINFGIKPNEFKQLTNDEYNMIKSVNRASINKLKELKENELMEKKMKAEIKKRLSQ